MVLLGDGEARLGDSGAVALRGVIEVAPVVSVDFVAES